MKWPLASGTSALKWIPLRAEGFEMSPLTKGASALVRYKNICLGITERCDYLTEVRGARREDNPVGLKSPPSPGLPAAQGAVHEGLVGEEVLEAGAEAGLVIIPFQTILLRVAHHDKRGERTFTVWAVISFTFQGHKAALFLKCKVVL